MNAKWICCFLVVFVCLTRSVQGEDGLTVIFEPSIGEVPRNDFTTVLMIIDISSVNVTYGSSNVTDLEDFNLTLTIEPEDIKLAYAQLSSTVKYDQSNNSIQVPINLYGGPFIGLTTVAMGLNISLWKDQSFRQVLEYEVMVVRAAGKSNIQTLLSYITASLSMLLLFTVCCSANQVLSSVKESALWIFVTVVIHIVLLPVVVLVLVAMFRVPVAGRLGLLLSSYSPINLVSLAFGVFMDADLTLMATLILASVLLSFVVMPLWSLQFNLVPDVQVSTPWVAMLLLFIFVALSIIAGLLVRNYYPRFATNLKTTQKPLAFVISLWYTFATLYGGFDLIPSVGAREGLVGFIWAFGIAVAVLVTMLKVGSLGAQCCACGLVLLLKGISLPYGVILPTLDSPLQDLAMVAVSFAALMTFLMAKLLLVTYLALTYICKVNPRGKNQEQTRADQYTTVSVDGSESINDAGFGTISSLEASDDNTYLGQIGRMGSLATGPLMIYF